MTARLLLLTFIKVKDFKTTNLKIVLLITEAFILSMAATRTHLRTDMIESKYHNNGVNRSSSP